MPRIELRLYMCKPSALPTILSLSLLSLPLKGCVTWTSFLIPLSPFPDLSIIGNKETFVMCHIWLAHRSDEQMLIVLDNCGGQATLIADLRRRHTGCIEVSRHATVSAILWLGIFSLYQWPLGGVGTKAVLKNGEGGSWTPAGGASALELPIFILKAIGHIHH